jgi:site-specific recombinase XerD
MVSGWRVLWVPHAPSADSQHELLRCWEDLEQREAAVRIEPGDPFMLDPAHRADPRLTNYLTRSSFSHLAAETKRNYTSDCRLFFNFLWSRGRNWDEATEDDWLDWEDWRRWSNRNPSRISDSKWDREQAALNRLYVWAERKKWVAQNPIPHRSLIMPGGQVVRVAATTAASTKSSDVRWLTPRAYRLWRDVGLRGYGADNTRDPRWSGRSDDRNAAYSDLLFSSGMRRTEGGSLLVDELPQLGGSGRYFDGRLAPATTKNRRGRTFYVTANALRSLHTYCETSRRAAIRRAQAQGRYEHVQGLRIVTRRSGHRTPVLHWVDSRGRSGSEGISKIGPVDRSRLFIEGPNGLEPMWLWLGENGLPFSPHSWENVYQVASRRCSTVLGDTMSSPLFMTPHMARHSFALHMLVALHHALDRRFGLTPEERRDLRMLYRSSWEMVQDLLGHRSVETTKRIYLAPVSDLQIRSLLLDDVEEETDDLLAALARSTERIQDVGE